MKYLKKKLGFFFNNKSSKFYSKYINTKINPMPKLINFNNHVYISSLNYFILLRSINLLRPIKGLAVSNSTELCNKDASSVVNLSISNALKQLLSPGSYIMFLCSLQLNGVPIQWNGLDLQSICSKRTVIHRNL